MVKKKNEILEDFRPAFELGGLSIGSSVLGGSLQSKLPPGVSNPLITTGSTTATFVAPLVGLGALSFVSRKLKRVEKKVKGRKK